MNSPHESSRDELVIAELRKRGDVASIPRPVLIWIYGSERDLQFAAKRLSSQWLIDIENQGDKWVLHAERNQPTSREAIDAMTTEIEAAISGTSANYDGWETSVERSN